MFTNDINKIIKIASEEILHPEFPFTKQFLNVHKIIMESHIPKVKDVDFCLKDKLANVYYPVEGEEFFFFRFC